MAFLSDSDYMHLALEQAELAAARGEVPVGAVMVDGNGCILCAVHNLCEERRLALAHAEMLAIEQACGIKGDWRLSDCTLYVTLEPCPMCMGAIIRARVGRVVYGVRDPRAGACGSMLNLSAYPLESAPETVSGVLEQECLGVLRSFFHSRRSVKNQP